MRLGQTGIAVVAKVGGRAGRPTAGSVRCCILCFGADGPHRSSSQSTDAQLRAECVFFSPSCPGAPPAGSGPPVRDTGWLVRIWVLVELCVCALGGPCPGDPVALVLGGDLPKALEVVLHLAAWLLQGQTPGISGWSLG